MVLENTMDASEKTTFAVRRLEFFLQECSCASQVLGSTLSSGGLDL